VARATGKSWSNINSFHDTYSMHWMANYIRGNFGDEITGEDFRFNNARRRSNSSSLSHHVGDLKTKFDFNEPEPVFEESIHGPINEDGEELAKTDSSESGRSSSV
jgi:hypothetical protein